MDSNLIVRILGVSFLLIIFLGVINGAARQNLMLRFFGVITFLFQLLLLVFIGVACVKKCQLQLLHAAIAGAGGGVLLTLTNSILAVRGVRKKHMDGSLWGNMEHYYRSDFLYSDVGLGRPDLGIYRRCFGKARHGKKRPSFINDI
jgi:hypothetical protein